MDELLAYESVFHEEMLFKPRFVSLLNNFEPCFSRQLTSGHVTGSAWIIDGSGTSTLLVLHKKLKRWLQPGGHADGEEDIRGVSLKEAKEETGLKSLHLLQDQIFDIDIHEIPRHRNVPAHFHYDLRFVFVADNKEPLQISQESNDLAWFPLNELSRFIVEDDSIKRMACKTQKLFRKEASPSGKNLWDRMEIN